MRPCRRPWVHRCLRCFLPVCAFHSEAPCWCCNFHTAPPCTGSAPWTLPLKSFSTMDAGFHPYHTPSLQIKERNIVCFERLILGRIFLILQNTKCLKITVSTTFPTLVVKSVSQFMSHDDSNASKVESSKKCKKYHTLEIWLDDPDYNFSTFVIIRTYSPSHTFWVSMNLMAEAS